jgi:hypothetical protein
MINYQNEHARRKGQPLFSGVLNYFPQALLAVAELSRIGNDQHNPGEPLHWAKGKSADHEDALARHLLERGTIDEDGVRHSAKVAWRALALLQTEIENEAEAEADSLGRYAVMAALPIGEDRAPTVVHDNTRDYDHAVAVLEAMSKDTHRGRVMWIEDERTGRRVGGLTYHPRLQRQKVSPESVLEGEGLAADDAVGGRDVPIDPFDTPLPKDSE